MDVNQDLDFFNFAPQSQAYHFAGLTPNSIHTIDQHNNGVSSLAVSPGQVDSSLFLHNSFDCSAFDNSLSGVQGLDLSATVPISPNRYALALSHHGSVDSGIGMESNTFTGLDLDLDNLDHMQRGGSEDGQTMTPAQSRRKAQNRAAQRAFRERKERHVRELEAKLSALTNKTSSLQTDNERLKLLLQRTQTENEILRATRSSSSASLSTSVDDPSLINANDDEPDGSDAVYDDEADSPDWFSTNTWSRRLDAGATWDLLQNHPLFLSGAVDVGEVCEKLKKLARCDGSGPVFDEAQVRRIIEDVAKTTSDELI